MAKFKSYTSKEFSNALKTRYNMSDNHIDMLNKLYFPNDVERIESETLNKDIVFIEWICDLRMSDKTINWIHNFIVRYWDKIKLSETSENAVIELNHIFNTLILGGYR